MNERVRNDWGLSDALGAVVLISVVVLGITVASVAILSSPVPDRMPALSVDIFNTSDTVFIRHDGGDTLVRGEYRSLPMTVTGHRSSCPAVHNLHSGPSGIRSNITYLPLMKYPIRSGLSPLPAKANR